MVVDFGKHFNKKINEIKVTWRFDDFMPSLSKVKCEKINIRYIYKNRSVKKEIHNYIKHDKRVLNKKFGANRVRLSVQFRSFLSNE